jgi:hypothetical protein
MTFALKEHRRRLSEHHMDFLGQAQVAFGCGRFATLFDQAIDDALGIERAIDARTRAGHKASYQLLRGIVTAQRGASPAERLASAADVFSALGYGTLELMVGRTGGAVRGLHLQHGHDWRTHYGTDVPRSHPADAFTTGFVAAATEVAYDLTPGSIGAEESECVAVGAGACEFDVRPATGMFGTRGVVPMAAEDHLPRTMLGEYEERVEPLVRGLRELLGSLWGDERGVIDAFGMRVVHHLSDYQNHLLHETLAEVGRDKPDAVESLRLLLAGAASAGAFALFGAMLSSEEWGALFARPVSDPVDVVVGGLALARASGYGRWALEEFEPDRLLAIVSPGTHESIYARLIVESSKEPAAAVLPGAATAIMMLAQGVTWPAVATVNGDLYASLALEDRWRTRITHSIARGDDFDRVEVRPRAGRV